MSDSLTIQNLVQYFEEKSRQIVYHAFGENDGKEPQYPMMVVYLGDNAAKGHEELYSNIIRMWPQYQHEIKFIGVQKAGNDLVFYKWNMEYESAKQEMLTEYKIRDEISFLFGLKNHFRNKHKILTYFVLDTSSIIASEEFLEWIDQLKIIKEAMGIDELDLQDMLIVLLNENLSKQKTGRVIRNCLCEKDIQNSKTIYLFSNRRSDNAITEDWSICYKMISCLIALSNNSNVRVMQSLFSKGLYTASYARSEKPSKKIAQVIVNGIIDKLSAIKSNSVHDLLEEENCLSRLGVTKEGYFHILNDYVDKMLVPLLPTSEQLELFPRRSMENELVLVSLSAKEISEETMGAWDAFLEMIVQQAQEKVKMDSGTRVLWAKQYANHLHTNFTAGELVYLEENLTEVKEKLSNTNKPLIESAVLSFAASNLKYLLSSSSEMVQFFVDVIEEEGEKARDFEEKWNTLLSSRMHMFSIRDENITKFYEKKIRNYFDYHEVKFTEEFKKVQDSVELEQLLKKTIDGILKSDAVFNAAFEDELETRMKEDGMISLDSKQYIRQKLTGEDVHTYLQVNFSYGNPILSSILLKTGTALHNNLTENLSSSIYYYDTGCGDCAEALNIYELQEYHIINDEGR